MAALPRLNPHVSLLGPEIRQELHRQLLQMDVDGFETLIVRLLQALEFKEVRALRSRGPGRRSHKGRTRHGGLDIEACLHTPVSRTFVAVQVKQYQRPVARLFVDALRGAMLRRHFQHGLLISTGTFAPAAQRAATEDNLLPITLLDGQRLLDLIFHHQLGVCCLPHKSNTPERDSTLWKIDGEFFKTLRASQDEPGRSRTLAPDPPLHRDIPSLVPHQHTDESRFNSPKLQKGGGMQWRTHVLLGLNSLWLLDAVPQGITPDTLLPLVLGTAFGSLLPDLDASESKIKYLEAGGIRPFLPLSSIMNQTLGHRGLLHSVSGLALCSLPALLLGLWWNWWPGLALLLGYASHLAGDACTRSGIPFFYVPRWHPDRERCHLLPPPLRLTTGSLAEEAVCALLALTALLLLLHQLATLSMTYQP